MVASNPVNTLKRSFPLPDPNDPIRSPRSSTHPLVCLSRMERSSISDLHHLTVSLRHLIEALNGNRRSLTHNCQREAFVQPRVCICVSGRKGIGTSTDTCAINLSLAAEHKVVLQQRTRQRMFLSSLASVMTDSVFPCNSCNSCHVLTMCFFRDHVVQV